MHNYFTLYKLACVKFTLNEHVCVCAAPHLHANQHHVTQLLRAVFFSYIENKLILNFTDKYTAY